MTSGVSRPAGWRRDLLFGLVAFLVVFATIYTVGRAAMPVFRSALGEIEVAGAGDGGGGEVSVVALRAELAPLERPVALLQASGAIEGRFVLDRGESAASTGGFFFPSDLEGSGEGAIDVSVRFTGAGAALTLVADQMPINQPRTDRLTIVLTSDGQTFNAARGACTLELIDAGYSTVTRPWGQVSIPHFAGHLACNDVSELRNGTLVSFVVVFDYTVEH
jgi:hypothetical protein